MQSVLQIQPNFPYIFPRKRRVPSTYIIWVDSTSKHTRQSRRNQCGDLPADPKAALQAHLEQEIGAESNPSDPSAFSWSDSMAVLLSQFEEW